MESCGSDRQLVQMLQRTGEVGDCFFVGSQASGAVAGLEQIVDGFLDHAGLFEVPSQGYGEVACAFAEDVLDGAPGSLVEVSPFGVVEMGVEIALEEVVAESVAGESPAVGLSDAVCADEAMAPPEIAAEATDDLARVFAQHVGEHLGGELLALDGGGVDGGAAVLWQPANALRDDGFDASRQGVPVERRPFDPASRRISLQIASFLQAAQQFNGEEGLPFGMSEQGASKVGAQPIGFAIQERVDKLLSWHACEVHLHFAEGATELVNHWVQGMPLAVAANGHIIGSVGAENEDAAAGEASAEVKEEVDRTAVEPLEVIQHEQQGVLDSHRAHDAGVLLEDLGLLHLGWAFRYLQEGAQFAQP